jgi:hypothetical protein
LCFFAEKVTVPAKVLMLLNAPYPADIRIKKETGGFTEGWSSDTSALPETKK